MRFKVRNLSSRRVGLGILLVGLGATALWLQTHRDASTEFAMGAPDPGKDQQGRESSEGVAALKIEIERLKVDRTRSEQRSAKLEHALSSFQSQLSQLDEMQLLMGQDIDQIAWDIDNVPTTGATAAPVLTSEEGNAQEVAETQTQIAFIDQSLFAEDDDPEWSESAYRALDEAFQNDEMRGFALVDKVCRSTMCRLELVLDGSTSPVETLQNLAQYSQWRGAGFLQIDSEGSVVVYLGREGHSFPQL